MSGRMWVLAVALAAAAGSVGAADDKEAPGKKVDKPDETILCEIVQRKSFTQLILRNDLGGAGVRPLGIIKNRPKNT
jgi:hypothetical protein